jgi:hypothetical protein
MNATDLRSEATYLRAALLLGLVQGSDVVAWAERMVESASAPSADLIELSVTPAELTALRESLRPLADTAESRAVALRLLSAARADFTGGVRGLGDTLTVLGQMIRQLTVPTEWHAPIKTLQDDLMLAHAGLGETPTIVHQRLTSWLAETTHRAN